MNLGLLIAIISSLALVVALYGILIEWRQYRAGQSIMTLLVSLLLLTSYILVARLVDRSIREFIANILGTGLLLAVWFIGTVMIKERFFRKEK